MTTIRKSFFWVLAGLLGGSVFASEYDNQRPANAPKALIVKVDLNTQEVEHFQADSLNLDSINSEIERVVTTATVLANDQVAGFQSRSEYDSASSKPAWYWYNYGSCHRYSWNSGYCHVPYNYYWYNYNYYYGYNYYWNGCRYHVYW